MEQQEQGPQNTIQFLTMMIKAVITGIPQMIKSMIVTSVISGAFTLGLHFYLILVPNDGYNSSGIPILDSILVLANVNPTPPNVLLFWFLANYLFWMIIGTFKEHGLVGGVKQFVTTPLFAINGLRESGFGAFPMIMGGLGFAFIMRLGVLGTMTTIQMFLMMFGIILSQEDSITLIGMDLFFTDVRKLVNRGKEIESSGFGLPTSMILGSIIGFAYLVFFPYNVVMVQILLVLMVLGVGGMFIQSRKKGAADKVALSLMLLCALSLMAMPVNADDGGAAETGGAMIVINNAPLRNKMIAQGIPAAVAGIAASIAASGRMTKKIFDQLKKGKIKVTQEMSIQEMQTMHRIRTKVLTNLQHIEKEVWFGKANKLWKADGEKGNILEHTDKLIDAILNGGEVDLNHYDKVYTVYTGHVTGRTITEGQLPPAGQIWRDTVSNGMLWTTQEIITGQTIDGQTSYKSMVLRGLVGYMTGGLSEKVYVPANMVYSLKTYSDNGGDSIIGGMWHLGKEGVTQIVIGKIIGGVTNVGVRGLQVTGKYLGTKFPGAARLVSNGMSKLNKTLNKKITFGRGTTPKIRPKVRTGTPKFGQKGQDFNQKVIDKINKKRAIRLRKQQLTGQNTKSPYPGVKDPRFGNAGKPPDLRGMPTKDIKGVRMICDKHGVKAQMRPSTKYARGHLENKTALAKPEMIKNKTINDIDSKHLGFPGGTQKGLAACKKPNPIPTRKPPSMSKREWRNLRSRHAQRSMEFNAQKKDLIKLESQNKVIWDKDTGIIYNKNPNGTRGLPYTGDNDAFAFVDAVSGKPVSPFTNKAINSDLQKLGVTQHNEHLGWDISKLSKTPGANGGPSKFTTAKGIDRTIMTGHGPGGEPLNTFNPLDYNARVGHGRGNGWSTSFWLGGQRQ